MHVRTTIRYDYSYIESAALSLGDDILEVSSWGEYSLNQVEAATLTGATIGGYPVYWRQKDVKTHIFDIVVGQAENVTIVTFKDMVSVRFTGSEARFGDSVGIMGSFDGILLARDGTSVMLPNNDFGQEWQVRGDEPKLFRTVRAPQAPLEKCRLPSSPGKRTRRLGERSISKVEAELACQHFSGGRKAACVYDVIATGDTDIATATNY